MNYIPIKLLKIWSKEHFLLLRPVMHLFLHVPPTTSRDFGNVSLGPKTKEDYFKRELPQKI